MCSKQSFSRNEETGPRRQKFKKILRRPRAGCVLFGREPTTEERPAGPTPTATPANAPPVRPTDRGTIFGRAAGGHACEPDRYAFIDHDPIVIQIAIGAHSDGLEVRVTRPRVNDTHNYVRAVETRAADTST